VTAATTTARPCDPATLIGVCAGNCGRRLHRHRVGEPYTPCAAGHPVNDGRKLCSACRRRVREAGMIATYPKTTRAAYTGDQRWRTRAACRDDDPEIWFPVATTGPAYRAQVADAKRVCRRCPVQTECLTEALARIPYGIAGGLTEQERAALRRGPR
jgi:hypothetical protein